MDRIFKTSSIEQICVDITKILNESKDYMEQMKNVITQAQNAVDGVPAEVREESVSVAALNLSRAIDNTDLDQLIKLLEECRNSACTLIPAADTQYAAQTEQLISTDTAGKEKILSLDDGKEERFMLTSTGIYVSLYQSNGTLVKNGNGYEYCTREQQKYIFDLEGYCF